MTRQRPSLPSLAWCFWIAWATLVALAIIYLAVSVPLGEPLRFHTELGA